MRYLIQVLVMLGDIALIAAAAYIIYCDPLNPIFWAIVLSALLAALAGVYPAQRAAKTNIVEALAYE
jgi:ABC-type lipoprotein release transport system permease subunit